eukprot:357311-Chlamydomonas_euryale.AAC.2
MSLRAGVTSCTSGVKALGRRPGLLLDSGAILKEGWGEREDVAERPPRGNGACTSHSRDVSPVSGTHRGTMHCPNTSPPPPAQDTFLMSQSAVYFGHFRAGRRLQHPHHPVWASAPL